MRTLLEQAPREASLLYSKNNCPGYVTGHLIEEARRSHSLLLVLFSGVQNCLCYEAAGPSGLGFCTSSCFKPGRFTLCSSKEAFACDYIGTSLLPRNDCPALGNDSMGIALWIVNLLLWYLIVLSWNILTKCWVCGLWSGVIAPSSFFKLLSISFWAVIENTRDGTWGTHKGRVSSLQGLCAQERHSKDPNSQIRALLG